ncbi:MAG TPA: DUF3618 domain-containing protein [Streptosporangiaceae bacterium]|nr:DUF3618 domain-containing protein [Streptosporangiaceae bacterium]
MTQDQDPEQIRDDIEQTQRELSADVDALTTKLSPQRVVHDRIQRARTAVGSMKQRVTGGAAQKASADGGTAAPAADAATGTVASAKGTVSSAASSAARTAGTVTAAAVRGLQANPVAAVLIAFGAGWLLAALLPSPVRRSERRTE